MSRISIYQVVGNNIAYLRKKRRITQIQLSALAAIDRSYIGKIESGSVNPSMKILHSIAEVLVVPVALLLKNGIKYGNSI